MLRQVAFIAPSLSHALVVLVSPALFHVLSSALLPSASFSPSATSSGPLLAQSPVQVSLPSVFPSALTLFSWASHPVSTYISLSTSGDSGGTHRKLNFSEGNTPSLLNRFSSQTEEIQFISRRSHRSGLLGSKLKGSSISHHPQLDNDLWNPAYSTFSTVTSKSVFTHYIITKLNYVMIPRPQFSKSFSLFTSYSLSEKLFFFLFMDMSYLPSILPIFIRYQVCFRNYLKWIRYNRLLKEFAIPSVP